MTAIRVLLVDDQELVRSGLRRILRPRDGFTIVGECGDGAEVPAALAAAEADVVVMDLRMKHVDGIEATRRLRLTGARPPVLALTTFDDDELLAGVLRAGAVGYVLKDSPAEDLIRAVRAVAAGDAWLDVAVTARVLTTFRQSAGHPEPGHLTPDQLELLRAAGRGGTDAEIARSLGLPEAAVKTRFARLMKELGLRDRAAAVVYAFDHGIVTARSTAATPVPPAPAPRPAAARLRFSVLGPLRAWRGTAALDLGPVRQQALLAALLLRPDVVVTDHGLLDDVWGLEPPGTGTGVLPTYVLRLRSCLRAAHETSKESVIRRGRAGYLFASNGVWTDLTRLRELDQEAKAAADTGDLAAAAELCADAIGLFQGEPLAGLPGPFAEGERLRLREYRLSLAQRKADSQLRLGRYASAADELSTVLAAHPHREPIAVLLMRALYARGLRTDALAVYQRVHDRLRCDFSVDPGAELARTRAAVLEGDDRFLGFA
ncbi:DNA-binding NarL/FixJ family response regulator/DNA-binding SARP family transcriptional activator [Amycolatopsis lexingtonensis]|uniref:DNA-binding NarL/FixJ family response regulator/DNA-binding SARP family transcriptional activator n=1 Tax=Amycolatopsis lexingtonensis TaxID=218822 RepID=A0ABR9HX65_9PSEU|nr:DNA-binding NarL/FixJ family response regulator/DNA-binding SARP family transcriptional activator [Amycolatopsis lexingtonensis]